MLDYDEESTVAVFTDACEGNKVDGKRNGYTEHKTPA